MYINKDICIILYILYIIYYTHYILYIYLQYHSVQKVQNTFQKQLNSYMANPPPLSFFQNT